MRYLLFIKHDEDYRNQTVPPSLYEAMGEFVGEGLKNGTMVDTAGLKPTADGWEVRIAKRKLSITDGPFTEAKEVIGGYALIDVKSREEAAALAKRFMEIHQEHWPEFEGACEVRPLEDNDAAA